MNRWLAIVPLLIALISQTAAKEQNTLTIQSNFMSWSGENRSLMHGSLPVQLYVPMGREAAFFMMTGVSMVTGSVNSADLTRMTDITDTQLGVNYHLPDEGLLLNLGMNLPTGKKELALSDEWPTISATSQVWTGFALPNIGQGFNLSPGITWVKPASENVVYGFGVAYQLKTGYKPIQDAAENFIPGDEVVLSGGLDIRTAPLSSVSFDLVYTYYMSDKSGDDVLYKSGGKIFIASQIKHYFGHNHLWATLRFRTKSKGQVPVTGSNTLVDETTNTYPPHVELMGLYRIAHPSKNYYGIWGEIKSYMKPVNTTIAGVGFMPEIQMQNGWAVPLKIKVKFGSTENGNSLFGFELGAGVRGQF